MATSARTAGEEWRLYYMLPIAAALGYATSVIHIYGLSPYIKPISEAFGWSRTQVTAGLTLSTMVQAVIAIPLGILVDRIGPRIFGVIGVLLTTGAFALLGTASGDKLQWYILWGVLAAATLPVQATIWAAAVASRFTVSRGLALAVTLCGASIAQTIFPLFGTWLIDKHGWRHALMIEGGVWACVAFPLILFFFRGAKDRKAKTSVAEIEEAVILTGATLAEGFRSTVYQRLFLVALLFTFTIIALVVHFVEILTDRGADKYAAAGIAGLIGIFSIVGRLTTGMLLDRFRASLVGAVAFLLPAIGCLCLLLAGDQYPMQMAAAIFIGLTLGAEIDVLAYLTTRHFGLKTFGGLYGGLMVALSIGTSLGPLAAARVFDLFGSYGGYLWLTVACMLVASILFVSLPQPAFAGPREGK